jgi:serine/threonine-protein kinase
LTGRPPFRGQTLLDTIRLVESETPPQEPSRLKPRVPRDLEKICRKCLEKDPGRRYESAAQLATDLRQFLEGRPTVARPVTAVGRLGKWVRRRPGTAALVGTLLLAVAGLAGGTGWYKFERNRRLAAQEADVRYALEQFKELAARREWLRAGAALERAEGRLGEDAPEELRQIVRRARTNLDMVARLEKARLDLSVFKGAAFDPALADRLYAAAFADYGVDVTAPQARDLVVESDIRGQLVEALDLWAIATLNTDREAGMRLLALSAASANDDWQVRFRGLLSTRDRKGLEELAARPEVLQQPPTTLILLSGALGVVGADAALLQVLRQGQQHDPDDFWINHELALRLVQLKPTPSARAEAIQFFRAALALRPNSAAIHCNLGLLLREEGRLDDALAACSRAIEIDPSLAMAYCNRCGVFGDKGDWRAAEKDSRRALELDPKLGIAHSNLGLILAERGNLTEGLEACQRAIKLDPKVAAAWLNLGVVRAKRAEAGGLTAILEMQRAVAALREAVRLDPGLALAHANLGHALSLLGDLKAGEKACRRAVELQPTLFEAQGNLGFNLIHQKLFKEAVAVTRTAVRLRPDSAQAYANLAGALFFDGNLDEAVVHARTAVTLDEKLTNARLVLAGILGERGDYDEAITEFERIIALQQPPTAAPRMDLAQVLEFKGRYAEALARYREGLKLLGVLDPQRFRCLQKIQELEGLARLEARLPALLEGRDRPADGAEAAALAKMCLVHKRLYAAAARFYAEAFVRQPALAEDLRAGHRYGAACAAALAGCGKGEDAGKLSPAQRSRYRKDALDWLRAQLALWHREQAKATKADREGLNAQLRHWQKDSDLAGVREPAALAQLPEDERASFQTFWADVAAALDKGARGM